MVFILLSGVYNIAIAVLQYLFFNHVVTMCGSSVSHPSATVMKHWTLRTTPHYLMTAAVVTTVMTILHARRRRKRRRRRRRRRGFSSGKQNTRHAALFVLLLWSQWDCNTALASPLQLSLNCLKFFVGRFSVWNFQLPAFCPTSSTDSADGSNALKVPSCEI